MKTVLKFVIASFLLGLAFPAFAASTAEVDNWMVAGKRFNVSGRVIDQTIFPLVAEVQSDHNPLTRVTLHFHQNAFDANVRSLRRHCKGAMKAQGMKDQGCDKPMVPFTIKTQSGTLTITETVLK